MLQQLIAHASTARDPGVRAASASTGLAPARNLAWLPADLPGLPGELAGQRNRGRTVLPQSRT
ncbi:hypothetical protein [Undibacterium sp. Ji49W]|uniref:hypothetical protein n=1 Tax=Undibacterium sp. Ji49W TaxID=3413040 RepID=UPI003BEFA133